MIGAGAVRFYIRALKARYRDQKTELSVIRQHVRPGDIVCDIGANKGSFVFWLARWCRSGTVVAFEPQPSFAKLLKTLCHRSRNVEIVAAAVYSSSGTLNLYIPKGHLQSASLMMPEVLDAMAVPVPTISLDEYFSTHRRISLLKIDVEGAEMEVFKGADRILREHSPLLVFECEGRHLKNGNVQDVFSYLTNLGYQGRFICGGRLLPISSFESAIHQPRIGEWFWKRKGYCNNFVFAKHAGHLDW
jgi:FkbM family methyltransferase